jgi:hypothetical protein
MTNNLACDARIGEEDMPALTNSATYTEGLRDLADMDHVKGNLKHVLRDCAKLIDKTERENGNLRIALWNEMRRVGLSQDKAIQVINDAASGILPTSPAQGD